MTVRTDSPVLEFEHSLDKSLRTIMYLILLWGSCCLSFNYSVSSVVLFVFLLCLVWPNVAEISGLSTLDCPLPSVFSNLYISIIIFLSDHDFINICVPSIDFADLCLSFCIIYFYFIYFRKWSRILSRLPRLQRLFPWSRWRTWQHEFLTTFISRNSSSKFRPTNAPFR